MIALQLLANQFHPHTLSSWEGLHDGLSVMGQVTRGGANSGSDLPSGTLGFCS